ncbi:MAG: hypothetical protein JSV01_11230 [Desulfobacterales bacterium]|nr:MAG: hypothetical protein JSV01_11230 [Desulfobacterales bacterium]
MSLELKQFLVNSYRPFVDERAKDVANDYSFQVDDAKKADEHSLSCHIYVKVTGIDHFLLYMTNSPMNHEIEQLVASKGGQVLREGAHWHVSVTLETADFVFILKLSEVIRDIVSLGRRYADSSYEQICPHTANSLERFANLLSQYEKQTRGMEKTRPDAWESG